jgi:hypothetical protein
MKDFMGHAPLATIIVTLASGLMFWVRGLTLASGDYCGPLIVGAYIYVMVVEPRLYARRRQREYRLGGARQREGKR